jgi:hypothetical protein
MRKKRIAVKMVAGMMVIGLLLGSQLIEAQEIRRGSELSGSIVAPLEQRKMALSAADKIFIFLDRAVRIKIGDPMEIFQVAFPNEKNEKDPFYQRVGQGTLLEIINPQLVLGVIDASIKEIAAGDRIYLKSPGE